ncbi:MAG: RNA-binding protein [Desulfobacteraceae bacterium 4572_87]|nr:MAG: RNA-binding protein [Desulfobacteraceae bacterium 4572_87]
MCESTAYILRDGKEEVFFEDVDVLENSSHGVKLVNIFGETKQIQAKIRQFSLIEHKIILEPC